MKFRLAADVALTSKRAYASSRLRSQLAAVEVIALPWNKHFLGLIISTRVCIVEKQATLIASE